MPVWLLLANADGKAILNCPDTLRLGGCQVADLLLWLSKVFCKLKSGGVDPALYSKKRLDKRDDMHVMTRFALIKNCSTLYRKNLAIPVIPCYDAYLHLLRLRTYYYSDRPFHTYPFVNLHAFYPFHLLYLTFSTLPWTQHTSAIPSSSPLINFFKLFSRLATVDL